MSPPSPKRKRKTITFKNQDEEKVDGLFSTLEILPGEFYGNGVRVNKFWNDRSYSR